MSKTYSLVCDKCKVQYWCGQGYRLYKKEHVAQFLHDHIGESIRFVRDFEDESIEHYEGILMDNAL